MWMIAILVVMFYASLVLELRRLRAAARQERAARRATDGRIAELTHAVDVHTQRINGLRASVELLAEREGIGGPAPSPRTPALTGPPPSSSGVRPRVTIDAPAEDETELWSRVRP